MPEKICVKEQHKMEITLFAKKRTSKEGKVFYNFLSTLTRKDGAQILVTVKFRDEAGTPKPESCPMNILITKDACNLSVRKFSRQVVDEVTGEISSEQGEAYTLWVSNWVPGSKFVDHSMDDYF